jgi:hypothetical protein
MVPTPMSVNAYSVAWSIKKTPNRATSDVKTRKSPEVGKTERPDENAYKMSTFSF